ncbi:hypothetical protein [Dyadobacter tibetensis]|uniref:hypothetical protein n=1 Tax=Dyadobacter tibetensis TaxID=1211851 RepID=UPI000471280E|nr:hypothetical protein [Dyadobacter tibetensis]
MKKQFLLFGLSLMASTSLLAQTKIKDGTVTGTSSLPNANAILDLESANKGLLLPRVALSSTTVAAPLSAHVAGMAVYNTATSGDVTPGYYYNDGTRWVSGASASDIHIYKDNGTLTSNRTMTMAGNTLRMNNAGTSTLFTHNFGEARILNTGINRGTMSVAAGGSILDMYVDNGNKGQLITSGTSTGLVLGTNNAQNLSFVTNGNTNATLTSAGDFGIATGTPTQKLDIGAGNVRIRDINTLAGASTDKMVVADANGVLKTMPKQNALLVGGDLSKPFTSTTVITAPAGGNSFTSSLLKSFTFTITQKSLVTFDYDVSYSWGSLSAISNGQPRMAATYFEFTSKAPASTILLGTPFANIRTPMTSTSNEGSPGFYFHNGSARLVLEPGNYTVELRGGLYSPSGPATLTFNGSQFDHVTIVADPNF